MQYSRLDPYNTTIGRVAFYIGLALAAGLLSGAMVMVMSHA